ncbi:hypothetical protein D3C74_468870 [compost metagenome]
MPAFSISSISTIGLSDRMAVSAIISARDWPPLSAVSGESAMIGSPVSRFACAITSCISFSM